MISHFILALALNGNFQIFLFCPIESESDKNESESDEIKQRLFKIFLQKNSLEKNLRQLAEIEPVTGTPVPVRSHGRF